MTTFAELGIPFPLFEAPVSRAVEYAGPSTCVLCSSRNTHCFAMGIGCDLILPCPSCGIENGLDANDREATRCRSCKADIHFPRIPQAADIHVCHPCLRNGKAAITKDTEFGMVSWEHAINGVTHGAPGLTSSEFETVRVDPDDEEWRGVRIPEEHLTELIRTPTFHTWQGECWLFCCKQPMIYAGEWADLAHSSHAPNDPETFFHSIIETNYQSPDTLWQAVCQGGGDLCVYVFRCPSCQRHRAIWDMS